MKKLVRLTTILGMLALGFYFYFTNVGQLRPVTNEIFVTASDLPPTFEGVRIVQISDVFIRNEASLEMLVHTVEAVNALQPDLVVFTGNLFLPEGLVYQTRTLEILQQVDANLSQLAVLGYHDVADADQLTLTVALLEEAGFLVLINDSVEIFNQAPQGIRIIGAAPTLDANSTHNLLVTHAQEDRFNVLLASVPTFSALGIAQPVHLQLSGHCLGEQNHSDPLHPCAQFYRGVYHFTDALTLNVSTGTARFHTFFGLRHRPSIDSFLLRRE